MNTQSHAVINLALLGKKSRPERNVPAVLGGILPDIPMFAFYFVEAFLFRTPSRRIWSERYYLSTWQAIFDTFHSLPLLLIGFAAARWFRRDRLQVVFVSMGLHAIFDLFLHHTDAHRHFWPFSDYRFLSPISYWEPSRFGTQVSLVGLIVVLAASAYSFRFLRTRIGKVGVVLVNVADIAFFIVAQTMGHAS